MKVLTWSYFCQTNSKSYDWKVKVTLTKSLKGCFAGASHSSLMFMYLKKQKNKNKGAIIYLYSKSGKQYLDNAFTGWYSILTCQSQWRGWP